MTMRIRALVVLLVGLAIGGPLWAQQLQLKTALRPSRELGSERTALPYFVLPDSVRQRVGYQHWKGGAIGAGLGALGGLALALAARGRCYDCSSDDVPVGKVTVVGAGLGGAFGFLVGLASPKYRWVPARPE
jgi:hypothetical protein